MSDTLVNHAVDLMAQFMVGKSVTPPSYHLGLYITSLTWSAATLAANVTGSNECSAPGYARIALTGSTWTGSTSSGVANYSYPAQTFTFTGQGSPAQTVFGWFFFDDANSLLAWGAQASSSYAIPVGGGTYTVTPTWQDQSC